MLFFDMIVQSIEKKYIFVFLLLSKVVSFCVRKSAVVKMPLFFYVTI